MAAPMKIHESGMMYLPNHEFFESLFRPRRPTEDGFLEPKAPWVVVQFSADWCGPCRRLNKRVLVERTPGVVWYYCDVDENPTSHAYAGLKGIPSFCVIRDGVFHAKRSGASGDSDVLQWLAEQGVPVA